MSRYTAFLAAALFMLTPATASAQDVLDRTVGPNAFGKPLEFHGFTLHDLGALAEVAGVPMGFEAALRQPSPGATPRAVVLTGRTLREAIALIIALDPRYEARVDDGVLLFEPARTIAALVVPEGSVLIHPLDAPVPAVPLGGTTAREAFGVVAALLGAPPSTAVALSDTKPFVLDAPEGTIRSLLNAIVRSHGHLVWAFERTTDAVPLFPYTLHFMSGLHGWGLGVSGHRSDTQTPLDLARFMRTPGATPDVMTAIVGTRRDGRPLVLTGMWAASVWDLSAATRVPIGMEVISGSAPAQLLHTPEFTATGRTLRDVLDILVTRDARYEWRTADRTIVIRPVGAWGRSDTALFAPVPDVDLRDVTMTQALRTVLSALGGLDPTFTTFPDSRTVSLSLFHGTALDLITALATAHGSLAWTFEDATRDEIRRTGRYHRLTVGVAGGAGLGLLVR